ncbi:unnamed protein product, partial [Urochloa humidicola]
PFSPPFAPHCSEERRQGEVRRMDLRQAAEERRRRVELRRGPVACGGATGRGRAAAVPGSRRAAEEATGSGGDGIKLIKELHALA